MFDPATGDGSQSHVAIVGMACRFPGAPDVASFWENLIAGRESITFYSDDELRAAGVDPALLADPSYVKAGAVLSGIEDFDALFFGFTPREAEVLDVQQRLFLECAWEALENAGVDPDAAREVGGVFAGSGPNTYLLSNLLHNRELISALGSYQLMLANDKDYLSTRVAYKLNLRGPAITVQTACSTSLVAVHLACQSLLLGECEVAIAGGVSVHVPHRRGYLHQEGMILSPDGHCRAFDRRAQGTVGGNGVGAVVLRRLEAALRNGDHVRAVIRGSAVNNDGAVKAGYTAPSVTGQSAAVAEALAVAGLGPTDISYIEAHGTGTPLGDPIEVAALRTVFGRGGSAPWCALGSVKTNIGHLDTAAGVAGLIKTVLALEHRQIPPSLHFEQPNPALELYDAPFYINARAAPWPANGMPRRAGVSSFGIGGTNAHVVVEEAPRLESPSSVRPAHVVVLSAKTATALEAMAANLAVHLQRHPNADLGDIAFTLSTGRKTLAHRTALVCRDGADAAALLADPTSERRWSVVNEGGSRPVAFTFCGQGMQYLNLGAGVYASEAVFRESVDYCAGVLERPLGIDIRRVLFADDGRTDAAADLDQTALSQPVLFTVQYAMARLWMHWGVEPRFMLGHSLGEYVAACLSGVFSLDDALGLVAERGRLMQQLPAGAMLSVPMHEDELPGVLPSRLSLAAVNAPGSCVISGALDDIASLQHRLSERGIECLRLRTSHAFHSGMMDPILRSFADRVAGLARHQPRIPFVSNVTGTWIRSEDAQDPEYWARHLRVTVRYLEGVRGLLESDAAVLIEVGPSQGLAALCRQLDGGTAREVVQSLRHRKDPTSDVELLQTAVARVWLAGGTIDWAKIYAGQTRRKVPLPTYPFERQRFWIEPSAPPASVIAIGGRAVNHDGRDDAPLVKLPDPADWFYVPSWKRSFPAPADGSRGGDGCWLVFMDSCGIGAGIIERLGLDRRRLVEVGIGPELARVGERQFVINPSRRSDYDAVIEELAGRGERPDTILHLWSLGRVSPSDLSTRLDSAQDLGFFSLLSIGQAIAARAPGAAVRLLAFSNNMHQVAGEDALCPEKATLLGPVTVLAREMPNLTARSIDVVLPPPRSAQEARLIDQLTSEVSSAATDEIVAIRDTHRWVPAFEPVRLEPSRDVARPIDAPLLVGSAAAPFRHRGVYLITGGLGGIGLTLAEHLARTIQPRLVLTSRRSLPPRDDWDRWENQHQGDEVSDIIRRLRAVEAFGAEVLVVSANVADLGRMQEVCRGVEAQFGSIHGMIHAAGIPAGGVIELKTREAAEKVLAPKVAGAVVLGQLARELHLDLLVFCSSLTSVAPEFGQVDYVSANAFLDAYVPLLRSQGIPAVGVNWDTWQGVGMAARVAVPSDLAKAREWELRQGIAPDEGLDLLQRIAASGLSRVVVSTRALDARLARKTDAQSPPATGGADRPRSSAHPRPALATPYVPPENAVQRQIAEDWQELLGIAPIGARDSFFELGGHSLLAIQSISRLSTTFHVQLTLTTFFEHATIAGVAALLDARTEPTPTLSEATATAGSARVGPATPDAAPEPSPRSRPVDDANVPLSISQQQLWLADQIEPGTARYNEFGIHEIEGSFDVEALQRSFDEIVRRHEVLRTTFALHDGSPVQKISPPARLPLHLVDLTGLADSERLGEARRLADEEATRPFNLTAGPLVRAALIRLSPQCHWLTLTIHHIVFDGWSGAVFVEELLHLYGAYSSGVSPQLRELPIQYGDFSLWQRDWVDDERRERQLAYWRKQLAGAPALVSLPYDHRPTGSAAIEGRRVNFTLDAEISRRLRMLAQHAGTTTFTTLLAAYAVLLHRYTGQEDLVIGAPVANRKWKVTEHMIGYFVNTLPLRVDLRGGPTFVELLGRLQRTVLEGHEHSDVAVDQLLPSARSGRHGRGPTIFPLLFVFRRAAASPRHAANGIRVQQLEYESVPARSDLDLYVVETEAQLSGYFVYPTALFERASIERMVRRFEGLIRQLVDRPRVSIADLPLDKPPSLSSWRAGRAARTNRAADHPTSAPLHVASEESD